ncbi:MAG: RusA family crossover junction endodeoxyribonuclease, partial [Pseudomonadota bacterium]|nr:RusA family crossover junction endodeoxyribonuclease [Pseudomonadota bacterium]
DAMNEIVWRDDKQVCEVHISKRYREFSSAVVTVRYKGSHEQ